MDITEPQPFGVSEYRHSLQKVFSEATREYKEAIMRQLIDGGFLQGFTGEEIPVIDIPTVAFRLRSRSPKVVEGRLVYEDWVIHALDSEKGDAFLNEFWLIKEIRVNGVDHIVVYYYDQNGSAIIYDNEGDITIKDLTDPSGEISMEGLEEGGDTSIGALNGTIQSLSKDFELVPFYSQS